MERRTALKSIGLIGLAGSVSAAGIKIKTIVPRAPGYFELPLGKLKLIVVTDGHSIFQPAQPTFAPGVPHSEVEKVLKENFLPGDAVDVAFNVLVVKTGLRTILIDTGCGPNFGAASGKLAENLVAAGIRPAEITDIVLTHAHPDHLGGILNVAGKNIFPTALVHIAEEEYLFWTAANPDFSGAKNLDNAFSASMVSLAKKTLGSVRGRMRFFKNGEELFGCLRTRIVPGHTPGHTLITISSGNESIMHMADISHDHVLLLSHPDWGVSFDTDFNMAAKARKQLLEEMAQAGNRIFSYHLPWPGIGFIRKKEQGYEWVPQAYATPQL